jgi:hypothetical protein
MYYGLGDAMMSIHLAEAQRGSGRRDPRPRGRLVRSGSWAQRRLRLLCRLGQHLVTLGQRLEAYGRPQSLSLERGTTGSR